MESEAKARLDRVLAKINSIDDLDPDTVAEMRGTLAGRFSIEKFQVNLSDWQKWSDKMQDVRGVEYDAQNTQIIIKATDSPLHDAAAEAMGQWLQPISERLEEVTGNEFGCIGTPGESKLFFFPFLSYFVQTFWFLSSFLAELFLSI